MVPSKMAADVILQYRELEEDVSCIEAGLMDLPPLPLLQVVSLRLSHLIIGEIAAADSMPMDVLSPPMGRGRRLTGRMSKKGRRAFLGRRKSTDASDENFFESLDNDDSMNEEDHSGILHNAAYDYSESETDQHDGLNGGEQAVLQNL
ncbi:unnamed protein product [Cuscuta europaea]|uniref:Uncharacterized protein n=1 Tax=Cuscuta europaea TaxID=41803 RepID=A0A9P0ZIP2_CUSEU|nr:unnamed protein product [Cuscuta europaea]